MESALALELVPLVFGGPPREDVGRGCEGVAGKRKDNGLETESLLVQRLREGDPDAFDVLVIEHLSALVGFATSFVGSVDAAEDIVQDALARVWDLREVLPREIPIRAYLFSAVRNRALDVLKSERVRTRTRAAIESEVRATGNENSVDDDEVTAHQIAAVRSALNVLPERQRTAIMLRYARGLKVAEIAAVFEVSVKAAEQLLVRALRTLREAVRVK